MGTKHQTGPACRHFQPPHGRDCSTVAQSGTRLTASLGKTWEPHGTKGDLAVKLTDGFGGSLSVLMWMARM